MFKYGSLRLFLIKLLSGGFLLIFGSFYFGSLITYNLNDPGFNSFSDSINSDEIQNFFGLGGAYLSSYSIIIIGQLSYFLSIFWNDLGIFLFLLKIIFNKFLFLSISSFEPLYP